MRIAFDLDDTLLPTGARFATEAPDGPWIFRPFAPERMRVGAGALLRELRAQGHRLWVYTSSARTPATIHLLFLASGVRLEGVVNLDRHEAMVQRLGHRRLKCPRAFGIDVLVDDSVAVAREAERHGDRVLRVAPDDPAWAEPIRALR